MENPKDPKPGEEPDAPANAKPPVDEDGATTTLDMNQMFGAAGLAKAKADILAQMQAQRDAAEELGNETRRVRPEDPPIPEATTVVPLPPVAPPSPTPRPEAFSVTPPATPNDDVPAATTIVPMPSVEEMRQAAGEPPRTMMQPEAEPGSGATPPPPLAPPVASVPPQAPAPPVAATPVAAGPAPVKKKGGAGKWILIILLILFFLGALAVAALIGIPYFMAKRAQKYIEEQAQKAGVSTTVTPPVAPPAVDTATAAPAIDTAATTTATAPDSTMTATDVTATTSDVQSGTSTAPSVTASATESVTQTVEPPVAKPRTPVTPKPRVEHPKPKPKKVAPVERTESAAEEARPAVREGELVSLDDRGVVAPRVKYEEEAKYPMRARIARSKGVVTVQILVGSNGRVENTRVSHSSGNELLDNSALIAARQNVYAPATKYETPVKVWISKQYRFGD